MTVSTDEPVHGLVDGVLAEREMREGIVGGQVDRDVVGGLALPQQEADALQVRGDVGHDEPPGVVIVEDGGGVESPAGLAGFGRGIRKAVADELIDALQEMQVGLGLHVEGRGAEDRGVQPGPGLGRRHGTVVEMARGSGPAGGGEVTPLRALAFGQVDERTAGERHGRDAVGLGAEFRAVLFGPLVQGREVVAVGQFGERLAPIVANGGSLVADVAGERGQVRREIVAAEFAELVEEIAGPIGVVDFQAVAEDGVGRGLRERLEHRLADRP